MELGHGFLDEGCGVYGVSAVDGGAGTGRRFALRPFVLLLALSAAPVASVTGGAAAAPSHRLPDPRIINQTNEHQRTSRGQCSAPDSAAYRLKKGSTSM